jgi:hypothetical protein
MPETLSLRGYAAHRGCTLGAVQKAISSGRIRKEPDGRIDPVKCDADWKRNTIGIRSPVVPPPAAAALLVPPDSEMDDLRLRHLKARVQAEEAGVEKKRLENEEKKRNLLDRSYVNGYVTNFSQLVRDHLLSMPERMSPQLASIDDENTIRKVLTKDMNSVLHKLNQAVADAGF